MRRSICPVTVRVCSDANRLNIKVAAQAGTATRTAPNFAAFNRASTNGPATQRQRDSSPMPQNNSQSDAQHGGDTLHVLHSTKPACVKAGRACGRVASNGSNVMRGRATAGVGHNRKKIYDYSCILETIRSVTT